VAERHSDWVAAQSTVTLRTVPVGDSGLAREPKAAKTRAKNKRTKASKP